MRRFLLGALVAFVAMSAPWRLMMLGIETLVVRPGHLQLEDAQLVSANRDYWKAQNLQERLEQFGWTVRYEPDSERYFGAARFSDRLIVINKSLSWNDKFAVLAHEGAHTLQPHRLTPEQGEIFAESVVVIVTGGGVRESARYLAGLRGDMLVMAVYWREIYEAAKILKP